MFYYEEVTVKSRQCTKCQLDISGLGIECLEWKEDCCDLCLECFSLMSIDSEQSMMYRFFYCGELSLSPNLNQTSPETVVPNMDKKGVKKRTRSSFSNPQPVKDRRWSVSEEIRLMDAIEDYGFGNWEAIGKYIKSKTPVEAKTHYEYRFINGIIGQVTWCSEITNEITGNVSNTQILKATDHTIHCDEGPLSPRSTQYLASLETDSDEMLELGYMPRRDEFEANYDEEAEELVPEFSFKPDDEELETELKHSLTDMYTGRLRERERRQKVIMDYQLVKKFLKKEETGIVGDENFENTAEVVAYEKMLRDKLRPFAQFQSSKEHEDLISNLVEEEKLKFRLAKLQQKYKKLSK